MSVQPCYELLFVLYCNANVKQPAWTAGNKIKKKMYFTGACHYFKFLCNTFESIKAEDARLCHRALGSPMTSAVISPVLGAPGWITQEGVHWSPGWHVSSHTVMLSPFLYKASLIAHSESTFPVSLQILKTAWNHEEEMPIFKLTLKYFFQLNLEGKKEKQRSSSCCDQVTGNKQLIPLCVWLHCRPLPSLIPLAQYLISKSDKLCAINK